MRFLLQRIVLLSSRKFRPCESKAFSFFPDYTDTDAVRSVSTPRRVLIEEFAVW